MLLKIIETEDLLNTLLPQKRLEEYAPTDLLIAAGNWSKQVWAIAKSLGPMPLTDKQIADGLHLANNPVHIFGVHRSGTTLLRDMLDGHPELCVLPSEGTWYTNQEAKLKYLPAHEWQMHLGTEWLRRLSNPINQSPYWLLGRSNNERSPYVDFARCVMAWWQVLDHRPDTQWPHLAIVLAYATCTNGLQAKYWVDKTPANERYLHRIQQEMPDAKMIHMIRHPLPTLASRKKMEPSVSLRSALRDIRRSFKVAIAQYALYNPQFLLMPYEDLCSDPTKAVSQMVSFLNISPSTTLLQPTVAGRAAKANSSFHSDGKAGEIRAASDHAQQQCLSKAEQKIISAYLGDLSAQLNYPLPALSPIQTWYPRLKYRLF